MHSVVPVRARTFLIAGLVVGALVPAAAAWALAGGSDPVPGQDADSGASPPVSSDGTASNDPSADPAGGPALATVDPASVRVDFDGDFIGWARLDRSTGEIAGYRLAGTNSTESMIKTWLVADYLRRLGDTQPAATRLRQASEAIRHSDDNAAQALYLAGGGNAVVQRMIEKCGLTDTSLYDGWWSRTQMSPRDAVRLGACIADGTAAGPTWTGWLLNEMRNVEGSTADEDQGDTHGGGRWGIIDGVPYQIAHTLAIKNGWTRVGADGNWHLNCLAVSDDWIMAVMMRYPVGHGLDYGAEQCAEVARQLTAPAS